MYCEEGRFTEDEARWILNAGRRSGLLPRLHACGHSRTGAARLAAEMGCASADMLHAAADDDVAVLARAGVAAVVCPGTALQVGARPPVRALLDKGVAVALGTDHTPGRNGITSMALVISLAVSYLGMSVEEALRAATIGGAHALKAPDRGAMVRGRLADMVPRDATTRAPSSGLSARPPPRLARRRADRGQLALRWPADVSVRHVCRRRGMLPSWLRAPRYTHRHRVAPVTLVVGEEECLVDRAVRDLIARPTDRPDGASSRPQLTRWSIGERSQRPDASRGPA